MVRIKEVNKVTAYCHKHQMCEHIEYVKTDGSKVYKCRFCYKEKPFQFPVYGKQTPSFEQPKREETFLGRQVA